MDNGWSTGQIRQEDAARNWAFRLPKMPQTIPSCPKQAEDLEYQGSKTSKRERLTRPSPLYFLLF